MDNEKKTENCGSATREPWKHPGQASQDSNFQPDPDVLEKEKKKKGIE